MSHYTPVCRVAVQPDQRTDERDEAQHAASCWLAGEVGGRGGLRYFPGAA